jgi:hypothetical protein
MNALFLQVHATRMLFRVAFECILLNDRSSMRLEQHPIFAKMKHLRASSTGPCAACLDASSHDTGYIFGLASGISPDVFERNRHSE